MKTVLKYLLPFKYKMSAGLTNKVIGTVVELFLPYILSHILKECSQSYCKVLPYIQQLFLGENNRHNSLL